MASSTTLTAQLLAIPEQLLFPIYEFLKQLPLFLLVLIFIAFVGAVYLTAFAALHIVAPKPRAPLPSEKTYITTKPDGSISDPRPLPCWYDRWFAERELSESTSVDDKDAFTIPDTGHIEPAEVEVSVVMPAYNEEKRIIPALEEAIEYLDARFGRPVTDKGIKSPTSPSMTRHHRHIFTKPSNNKKKKRNGKAAQQQQVEDDTNNNNNNDDDEPPVSGYEIIIVNDGSTDRTIDVVLEFSRAHRLHDILRIVTLAKNRGKGGGVTHGLRHVRGAYVVFADADGASRFADLGKLIEGCEDVLDASKRGVAIGSRGHLVGSEAVVQRSALRNFLMKSFHTVIKILTPPATSRIRDTQCGFKLFSRAALPHIIPYMHAEGWIFDIEMLMLAESAPPTTVVAIDGTVIGISPGIRVAEVPIDWHEVDGSKMNLIKDSIGMAYGLAILRFSWMLGVYRRRTT